MILIAGPCVIESEESVMRIAESLKRYDEDETIDFYFKASLDKANRTSLESYRGPGLEEGMRIFEKVKERFGYKTLTDVHESCQVRNIRYDGSK
jgi:2-dehydro-3-deoxyphosphooctonate aldolase (KDO 8-P synthase)